MRRTAGLLLAAALTSACQSAPGAPQIALARNDLPAPLTVAVPISANPAEGMTTNDWGGEIPKGKPAGAVSEGGLGDIR